jgi:hypothetical protein
MSTPSRGARGNPYSSGPAIRGRGRGDSNLRGRGDSASRGRGDSNLRGREDFRSPRGGRGRGGLPGAYTTHSQPATTQPPTPQPSFAQRIIAAQQLIISQQLLASETRKFTFGQQQPSISQDLTPEIASQKRKQEADDEEAQERSMKRLSQVSPEIH